MLERVYLIFDSDGFVACRKNQPNLASGQIAVRVAVEIPNKWFYRSIPQATISLPEPPEAEATTTFEQVFVGEETDEDDS